MTVIELSIPYDKKDELKQYKIKWHTDKKTWYFDGEVLPIELEKYVSKYVDISYEDKDLAKATYNSMSFDKEKKMWKMSMEHYNQFTFTKHDY